MANKKSLRPGVWSRKSSHSPADSGDTTDGWKPKKTWHNVEALASKTRPCSVDVDPEILLVGTSSKGMRVPLHPYSYLRMERVSSGGCDARYYLRALRADIAYICGHGQESGMTFEEEMLVVIASSSGSLMFTSLIAVCMSFVLEMDVRRIKHMSKVEMLNHYLGRRAVPLELRHKVRKFMEVVWETEGGADETLVHGFVSRSLRRSLCMHNTLSLLRTSHSSPTPPRGFSSRSLSTSSQRPSCTTTTSCSGERSGGRCTFWRGAKSKLQARMVTW